MGETDRDRLVIFGESGLGFSTVMIEAVLRAAAGREDLAVAAVCDTSAGKPPPRIYRRARKSLAALAVGVFTPSLLPSVRGDELSNLYDVARRHSVDVVVPRDRDVNHPAFRTVLADRYRPTLALTLGCHQIFHRELLGLFEMAVNCHDGLLPRYRGYQVTAWSLYRGEEETGLSWHVMNESIDGGPVLFRDAVPVDGTRGTHELFREKVRRAVDGAGRVLDMMAAREPGVPQGEGGHYFGKKEYRNITEVGSLSGITWAEVQKRLGAFGALTLSFGGKEYRVTEFEIISEDRAGRRPVFTTSDGVTVRMRRCLHLPPRLYGVLRLAGVL